jgi:hypothetical protein
MVPVPFSPRNVLQFSVQTSRETLNDNSAITKNYKNFKVILVHHAPKTISIYFLENEFLANLSYI